jgi:hypothetical protein
VVEPLEPYWLRFWKRFGKDATPWARDNIVGGVVVLIVPAIAIYIHDPHAQIDWVLIKNSLLLYAFAFAVYTLAHLCRTPKKLDLARDTRELALLGVISVRDQTIKERELELAESKRTPPTIEVGITELHRTPVDGGRDRNAAGEMSWHIFLLARIELQKPISISILKYSLRLSLDGNQVSLESQNDLDAWVLHLWTPNGPVSRNLPALSLELGSGEPMEGWLHFMMPQTTPTTLDQVAVRLIADSGRGLSYGEPSGDARIWNLDTYKRFARKT